MCRALLFLVAFMAAQTPNATAEEAISLGRELFAQYCMDCHGIDGRGHITPENHRTDLTKISERRSGVWPMLAVMSMIDGYTRPRAESGQMPVIDALSKGPVLDFDTGNGVLVAVPERLLSIALYLESIQSPMPERYVP